MTGSHAGKRILVCGGSGRLGRQVAAHLAADPRPLDFTIGSRSPERLAGLESNPAKTIRVDFDDRDSLVRAFQGADRVLLISPGSDPTRLRRRRQLREAIRIAEQCGVEHIVYTSILGARFAGEPSVLEEHGQVEEDLRESDLGWTVLRNCLYADQFVDSLPLALAHGKYTVAFPHAPIAYVTRDDCAYAAYRALASDFRGRRCLNISGPQAFTRSELVRLAADELAMPVRVADVDLEESGRRLSRVGVWKHVVDAMAEVEAAIGNGIFATPSGDFLTLAGRPPECARTYLRSQYDRVLGSARNPQG